MSFLPRLLTLMCSVMALTTLPACSVRQHLLHQAANEIAQSSADEEDIGLAREASAFYLKLSEGLLRSVPDHLGLAQSVTSGLTQYAYAFLSLPADRLESHDLAQAQALRLRAARMYARAKQQGLRTLTLHQPDILQPLDPAKSSMTAPLRPEALGLVYWTAAAWGGQIALSTDEPEAVADLPVVVSLAHKAWRTDPAYGQGDLASLMGTLELSRPGGSREQALRYFDQAIAISQGQTPGPWVAKAEGWALDQQDRAAFEACLHKAVAVSLGKRDLSSQIMRERAQWLLTQADSLF